MCHVAYGLLCVALPAWIITYSCANNRHAAKYVLVVCQSLAFTACGISTPIGKMLMAPLVTWLLFAQHISLWEISMAS